MGAVNSPARLYGFHAPEAVGMIDPLETTAQGAVYW
jgi:hypothetical protein